MHKSKEFWDEFKAREMDYTMVTQLLYERLQHKG